MQAAAHNTTTMHWEPFTEFPGEAEVKMLRHEPPSGAKTMLIRLPAGGSVSLHAHVVTVQHYVLEGEYQSEGGTFAAGSYRLLPWHENVSPIYTKNGVTILMIYDPVQSSS